MAGGMHAQHACRAEPSPSHCSPNASLPYPCMSAHSVRPSAGLHALPCATIPLAAPATCEQALRRAHSRARAPRLAAAETGLHEALLQSPHRTLNPEEAGGRGTALQEGAGPAADAEADHVAVHRTFRLAVLCRSEPSRRRMLSSAVGYDARCCLCACGVICTPTLPPYHNHTNPHPNPTPHPPPDYFYIPVYSSCYIYPIHGELPAEVPSLPSPDTASALHLHAMAAAPLQELATALRVHATIALAQHRPRWCARPRACCAFPSAPAGFNDSPYFHGGRREWPRTLSPQQANGHACSPAGSIHCACARGRLPGMTRVSLIARPAATIRVHSAINMLIEVHAWIRSHHPWWDRHGGRDHIIVRRWARGAAERALRARALLLLSLARLPWQLLPAAMPTPQPATQRHRCMLRRFHCVLARAPQPHPHQPSRPPARPQTLCACAAANPRRGVLLAARRAAPRCAAHALGKDGPRPPV